MGRRSEELLLRVSRSIMRVCGSFYIDMNGHAELKHSAQRLLSVDESEVEQKESFANSESE